MSREESNALARGLSSLSLSFVKVLLHQREVDPRNVRILSNISAFTESGTEAAYAKITCFIRLEQYENKQCNNNLVS